MQKSSESAGIPLVGGSTEPTRRTSEGGDRAASTPAMDTTVVVVCRVPHQERESTRAGTAAVPLDQFLPEFEQAITDSDRELGERIARLVSSPQAAALPASDHAPDVGEREPNQPQPPPLLVVRKAGIARSDFRDEPATAEAPLALMVLRGVWSAVPPLRPLIRAGLASPKRMFLDRLTRWRHGRGLWSRVPPIRPLINGAFAWVARMSSSTKRRLLERGTRWRRHARPVWLAGYVACLVMAALIARNFSGAPVETAEPRDAGAAVPSPAAASASEATPVTSDDRPRLLPVSAPVAAVGATVPQPPPAPTSAPVVTPSRAPQASSSTRRPQASRTAPAGVFEGTLLVRSEPAGAAVFIDRQRVGQTPIEISNVRAGSHAIWIEHAGYVRWTAGINVRANAVTRIDRKLERRFR